MEQPGDGEGVLEAEPPPCRVECTKDSVTLVRARPPNTAAPATVVRSHAHRLARLQCFMELCLLFPRLYPFNP